MRRAALLLPLALVACTTALGLDGQTFESAPQAYCTRASELCASELGSSFDETTCEETIPEKLLGSDYAACDPSPDCSTFLACFSSQLAGHVCETNVNGVANDTVGRPCNLPADCCSQICTNHLCD